MRPDRLVVVAGTGTEVGKTWVGAMLLRELVSRGVTVAARKPAQSFDVDHAGRQLEGLTDAEVLGSATGEPPDLVCRPGRSYRRAMAPPIAAEALGLPPFGIADLVGGLEWPPDGAAVGLVETAGGVRSPQATDGDVRDVVRLLEPELVLLVAEAGLGTINGVRLSIDALHAVTPGVDVPVTVVLNRFDANHDIHVRNAAWLTQRDGFDVVTVPGGESALADLVAGT